MITSDRSSLVESDMRSPILIITGDRPSLVKSDMRCLLLAVPTPILIITGDVWVQFN